MQHRCRDICYSNAVKVEPFPLPWSPATGTRGRSYRFVIGESEAGAHGRRRATVHCRCHALRIACYGCRFRSADAAFTRRRARSGEDLIARARQRRRHWQVQSAPRQRSHNNGQAYNTARCTLAFTPTPTVPLKVVSGYGVAGGRFGCHAAVLPIRHYTHVSCVSVSLPHGRLTPVKVITSFVFVTTRRRGLRSTRIHRYTQQQRQHTGAHQPLRLVTASSLPLHGGNARASDALHPRMIDR